ncbi:MAG: hypothetical protein ACTSUR_01670 [Candidatus Heimdallarchaeaceae archaeon]
MREISIFLFFSFFIINVLFLITLPSYFSFAELSDEEIHYTVGYYKSTPEIFFECLYSLDFGNIPLKSQEMIVNIKNKINNSIYAEIKFKRFEAGDVIFANVNITNKLVWLLNSSEQWLQYASFYNKKQEFNAILDLYKGVFTLTVLNNSRIEKIEVDIYKGITTNVEILPQNLDETISLWISLSTSYTKEKEENPKESINIRNIVLASAGGLILLIPILYSIYKLIKKWRGKF